MNPRPKMVNQHTLMSRDDDTDKTVEDLSEALDDNMYDTGPDASTSKPAYISSPYGSKDANKSSDTVSFTFYTFLFVPSLDLPHLEVFEIYLNIPLS